MTQTEIADDKSVEFDMGDGTNNNVADMPMRNR